MAYYPIVRKKDAIPAGALSIRLPTFYMEDFSVLGLRVNDCEQAVRILGRHAFAVGQIRGSTAVNIDTAVQMQAVVQLLADNGLDCEIGDLVDGIYQG